MVYESVIGLEIHAELNTKTKMYCNCANTFGAQVNTNICPVCTGMPGSLPSLNKEAVIKAIMIGKMMNCNISKRTRQYRKHYRYPDLPKGYQISQFSIPLCTNGYFDYYCKDKLCRAYIHQIHIEEDAGKLIHDSENTYVDYNRCGVPLIEIVTEPCFNSADEAVSFMEAVRIMLLDLGVSDCRMEEGSLRADVNVSLRKPGENLGTRVEMKNIATFAGARRAIDYEIMRQKEILSRGEKVEQLTRRWDDEKGIGITMRDKENAQDYRFMPEPDIPCIEVRETECELPPSEALRRAQLCKLIPYEKACEISRDLKLYQYFMECKAEPEIVANFLLGIIAQTANEQEKPVYESCLSNDQLCDIIRALKEERITNNGAKLIIKRIFVSGESVEKVICDLNLSVSYDENSYRETAIKVISDNPKAVSDYRAGKQNAIGFLVGQCMRKTGASANAAKFKDIILKELGRERLCR